MCLNSNLRTVVFYLLKMSATSKQMEQRATGGNYPAITQEELGDIVLPYVDKSQQTEIVTHISQIRAAAKQLQQDAAQILTSAKADIERMILGDAA